MLARNFLSAEALGITEQEHDALVKVLGMLERDEIPHLPPSSRHLPANHRTKVAGFNMQTFYAEADCGTVCCICGWAEYVGKLKPGKLMRDRFNNGPLHRLFDPSMDGFQLDIIQPHQAAAALRNYLGTGEPNWRDVLATAE